MTAQYALVESASVQRRVALILEHEECVESFLSKALLFRFDSVAVAHSFDEAFAICATSPVPIDLMVAAVLVRGKRTDLEADRVQRLQPGMRTLLISTQPLEWLLEKGLVRSERAESDRLNFIQKPFTKQELLQAVDLAMGSIPVSARSR